MNLWVLPVYIDVFNESIAKNRDALVDHVLPFAGSLAIVDLQPAVGAPGYPRTEVTLFLADQGSVDRLKHLSKVWETLHPGHFFVKGVGRKRTIYVPILEALRPRALHQGLELTPGPRFKAKLRQGEVHNSRVHTLLQVRLWNQQPWSVW